MFVTNWISTTKIQKILEITNFFRHYFLSRTEVKIELQPLNKDGFQTIEIPEDNEVKIATIGVLKYIIR